MPTQLSVKVPMDVTYQPAWLTWVASATTCLKALGVECDNADVAGHSGYAFHLCVHEQLCPSGPTVLDWGRLLPGIARIGRSTVVCHSFECHTGEYINDRTKAHCRAAFELAKREIEAGRPCVVWGAYVPEFAAVTGIEGDCYLVSSFKECLKEEQPPIRFDEVEAPGGSYVLGFPTPTQAPQRQSDRSALINALDMLHAGSWDGKYARGLAAYDAWIDALEACRASVFGNAYNTACYSEGRHFARDFIKRLAGRNEFAAGPLGRAAAAYALAADVMQRLGEMFPFPGEGEVVDDDAAIGEAVGILRSAKDSETRAAQAIEEAVNLDWSAAP